MWLSINEAGSSEEGSIKPTWGLDLSMETVSKTVLELSEVRADTFRLLRRDDRRHNRATDTRNLFSICGVILPSFRSLDYRFPAGIPRDL